MTTENELFDVVAVSIATGLVTMILARQKRMFDADAVVSMAVLRRGCETEFYAAVKAGQCEIGRKYFTEPKLTP